MAANSPTSGEAAQAAQAVPEAEELADSDRKLAEQQSADADTRNDARAEAAASSAATKARAEAEKLDANRVPTSGAACTDSLGVAVADSDFEKVVMDKAHDVFVLFYKPSAKFCDVNGTHYADFSEGIAERGGGVVIGASMDVSVHKSPFVFEADELPVVMLFPSVDKRPLEFDGELNHERLATFAKKHCPSLQGAPKAEL